MARVAHLVEEIRYDDDGGFSWHHPVWNWLADAGYLSALNEDSSGMVEVPIEVIEELTTERSREEEGIEMTKEEEEQLRYDVKKTRERGHEYVRYYCW